MVWSSQMPHERLANQVMLATPTGKDQQVDQEPGSAVTLLVTMRYSFSQTDRRGERSRTVSSATRAVDPTTLLRGKSWFRKERENNKASTLN